MQLGESVEGTPTLTGVGHLGDAAEDLCLIQLGLRRHAGIAVVVVAVGAEVCTAALAFTDWGDLAVGGAWLLESGSQDRCFPFESKS